MVWFWRSEGIFLFCVRESIWEGEWKGDVHQDVWCVSVLLFFCSMSKWLNEKCYTLSFAIRPLPSRLGTWARWQLHHGEAEQGERAFSIWKRRSFHFGSDLGCCPSFFRYNFNSRKFTKNPWGDDIIIVVWKHQLCQHQLNPNSSNMAAHHLGGPRNLRIIQRFRGFSWITTTPSYGKWLGTPPITLLMCSWVFPLLDLENGKIESE